MMKYNGVVTNIPQYDPDNGGFTDEEKALGRKNIGAGGISTIERDGVPVASGDLVLGRRTGGSMREIAVNLRDPDNGDTLAGYLVPPRTSNGKSLICDASGNITWGDQPSDLSAGDHIYIDDQHRINVTGLQEELNFDYTPDSAISAINGSPLVGGGGEAVHYSAGDYVSIDGLVISVTGLQPSGNYQPAGDYAYNSAVSAKLDASAYTAPVQSDWNQNDDTQLDYIKNKPTIPSLDGYATEEYVNEQTSGKLEASAYHEYSAGLHLSLQDYVFNVTGVQEELQFDYDDLGKISAINGSALHGNGEEPIEYSAGEHIGIESDVISVTGLENLSAGPNVDIYEVDGHLEISAAAGGGEGQTYYAGQYVNIDAGNYINVTGLQPVGDYQPAGEYAYTSALSAYAPNSALSAYALKTYVNNNFMKTSAMSAYATNQYVNNKFVFNSAYTEPVQSDWIEDDVDDLAYIKNKPTPIGLIAGSGIYLEDMTSAVKISCSAAPSQSRPTTWTSTVPYNQPGDTNFGWLSSCSVSCSISSESYCQIKVTPYNSATIVADQSTIKSINGKFDGFRVYNYPWNTASSEMLTANIPYDSNNNGTIDIDLMTSESKFIHLTIWYRVDTTNSCYQFYVVEEVNG
jgi:hypothetical protein